MQITPEMIEALKTLRVRAAGGYVSSRAAEEAFTLLDQAGLFAVIDEAAGERR